MSGVEVRPALPEEVPLGAEGMRQTFRYPPAAVRRYLAWPLEDHWAVVRDGRWAGGIIAHRMEQWFGGRAVPCAAIYGVQVAPEARGRGLGRTLFAGVLDRLAEAGVALAPLYPSDSRIYRAWGWEFAGATTVLRIPVTAIEAPRSEPPVPWELSQLAEVDACQRRLGRSLDGPLVRTDAWWRLRLLGETDDEPTWRYAVRRGDRVTGYLVYRQAPPASPVARGWQWDLVCAELAWEDAEARDTLLSFMADQGPAAHYVVWTAPETDTLGGRGRMELVDAVDTTQWMTRIVDVERALELRGYAPGLDADLALTVTDPLCPRNSGSFRLAIRDGRGTVERVTGSGPTISVRGLSALYAGAMTPQRAVEAGLLVDATEADLGQLGRAFGGRGPWMPDKF